MKNESVLILASSSSSRKMVLDKLKIPYETMTPNIDEIVLEGESVEAHVLRLSKEKALKVADVIAESEKNALIIGCDSVCVLKGEIMSKPENHPTAVMQLQASSGNVVYFYTGLTVYHAQTQRTQQEVVRIAVHFKRLTDELIERYLEKERPYHCAGSIQIEGLGVLLVEKVLADDPNSLVGLPLIALIRMLEEEGFSLIS